MATSSPDSDVVKGLLYGISDHLSSISQDESESERESEHEHERESEAKTKAKALLDQLKNQSNPQFTMDLLVPNILVGTSEALNLSHDDAMSVLKFLAISDTNTYMLPASRSVKTVAQQLISSQKQIHFSDHLLQILLAQFSADSTELASNAAEALLAICHKLPPVAEKALPAIGNLWDSSWEMKNMEKQSATTICVRCASATVDIVCLENHTAQQLTYMQPIVQMLQEQNDPLLQMSVLDLITKLATTMPMQPARAKWLYSKHVLEPLLHMVGGEQFYPDPILGGPALKLLACLCRLSQQDSSLFTQTTTTLLTTFHHALTNFGTNGELDRLALLDAISSFASASPDALEIVLEDMAIRQIWLNLSVAQPKLKSALLHSIAMVLDPPTLSDVQNLNIPSNALSMRLFSSIGAVNNGDATELVLSLAKSPFIETRIGAYTLLAAFAKRGAGAQILLTHAGFYEWLISREDETIKEGKEAKYKIVSAVVKSGAKSLLADDIVTNLEKYVRQGPYYVQTLRWDVATE